MSNYTQINLVDDVEDVAAGRPGLEAHIGRKHLDSRDLGVSLFRYDAETRSAMTHSHREQEEAYLVVEGSGRMLLGDEVVDLRQWDVVRVAPEVERAFEAGADGLSVVAVGGPRPEGGDGVRGGAEWPGEAG